MRRRGGRDLTRARRLRRGLRPNRGPLASTGSGRTTYLREAAAHVSGTVGELSDIQLLIAGVLAFVLVAVAICLVLDRVYPPPPCPPEPVRAAGPTTARGFEVVGPTVEVVGVEGQPLCVFRVVGVERTTQLDVDLLISAATPANAHVKAELRGIVVTGMSQFDTAGQVVGSGAGPVVRRAGDGRRDAVAT